MDETDLRILIGATAAEAAPPELLELCKSCNVGPGSVRPLLEAFWENLWIAARDSGGIQGLIAMTKAMTELKKSLDS